MEDCIANSNATTHRHDHHPPPTVTPPHLLSTGILKQDMPGIVCTIQANVYPTQDEVLEKVSKFERDTVDTSGGIAI